MNKNKALYIGSFPPPYGGVTIKNKILFSFLKAFCNVVTYNGKSALSFPYYIVKSYFCSRFIIAVGSNSKLFKLIRIMCFLHPKKIRRSIVVVMGGTFSNVVVTRKKECEFFKKLKGILVETVPMRQCLMRAGFSNVYVFPNCRPKPDFCLDTSTDTSPKFLYFSLISKQKGADMVLDLASEFKHICFDFWGEIDENYKETFFKRIGTMDNCKYKGIYKKQFNELYSFLNNYDVLLFPSIWEHEGVSGVLIEAKIAGLPAIVTDWNYNALVVKDNVDGIVMETNDYGGLKKAFLKVLNNKAFLSNLKAGAIHRGELFYIDTYKDLFFNLLEVSH